MSNLVAKDGLQRSYARRDAPARWTASGGRKRWRKTYATETLWALADARAAALCDPNVFTRWCSDQRQFCSPGAAGLRAAHLPRSRPDVDTGILELC